VVARPALGRADRLAIIDIDDFRKYNDYYGHRGGDECLRLVAQALQASIRNTDLVAATAARNSAWSCGRRPAGALRVAERACRAVADLHAPHAATDGGIVTVTSA